MSTTPNLGLTKPDIGSTDWGSAINANWDTLDEIFTAPSSLERHVYPGDSIQDAIDAVPGGAVILHPGTHTFSSTLTIDNDDSFTMIGFGQNTLLQYSGSGVAIDINVTTGDSDDIFLGNFRLVASGTGTHGIRINSGSMWAHNYVRLGIRDFSTAGIYLDGTQINNFCISECNIVGNGTGIYGDKLSRGRIVNNVAFGNTSYGIRLLNASSLVKIIGNSVKGGTSAGIRIEGSSLDCVVEGNTCDLQTSSGDGISVDTCQRISIVGNTVYDANSDGIFCNACDNLLVSNNLCSNCSGDGINLDDVDESAILSNRCLSNTGNGISADASCDQNLYDGNHTRGNTAGGLSDSGTNSTTGTNK